MYDLITIGSVTIDFFFKGDSLTRDKDRFQLAIGGKYLVDFFYEGVGGSGANVAIWCSREGLDTAVVAKVGENIFKQMILQKLIKRNVSTEFLLYDKDFHNVSSILLSENGEKTVIQFASPYETLNISDLMHKNIAQSKAIFMGSLADISVKERIDLLSSLRSEEKAIFLNIGVFDCRRELKEIMQLINLSDVFLLNTHEFSELFKKGYETIDFEKNCAELIDFKGKVLVLTDGENGSYAYCEGKIFKQPGAKIEKVVDTTGAGDSFTAGFIAGYLDSGSIEDALERGTACAKKNLEAVGAN